MTFIDAIAFSIVPLLAAIVAGALILPRAWLAGYAALVIGAIVVSARYTSPHAEDAMGGLASMLVGMLMAAALAAGLATRWALKARSD